MASKKRRIRQYQWRKRVNKHGFRTRLLTKKGRVMLAKRRAKGRHSLAPQRPKK